MTSQLHNTIRKAISPLLRFRVSCFRIGFVAEKPRRIYGMETAIRGRLGFNLKRMCCPFPGFRQRVCDTCVLRNNCLYITLFAPGPDARSRAKTLTGSWVRPFVIRADGAGDRHVLESGETGTAEFTLFGPGIQYCSLFLEAAVSAIASFDLAPEGITIVSPGTGHLRDRGAAPPENGDLAWPLSEWTHAGQADTRDRAEDVLRLHLLTPVHLVGNGRQISRGISFALLIRSLLRRLRDLRRAFGEDSDMGQTGRDFYEAAEAVRVCEDHLYWSRRKRYSYRQHQDVYLNGFKGDIGFSRGVLPFVPLVRAGEIVHVGKGTSSGNGRIAVG